MFNFLRNWLEVISLKVWGREKHLANIKKIIKTLHLLDPQRSDQKLSVLRSIGKLDKIDHWIAWEAG